MGEIGALVARLTGQRAYLDSNVFVYFLDRNPEYFSAVAPIIEAVGSGAIVGFTGDAAVAEVMVRPYRMSDPATITGIKAFFAAAGSLSVLPHDGEAFDLAAQLRARHGMKFIDALHLATAMRAGCRYFVTNDDAIRSQGMLEVVGIRALAA